MSHHHMRPPPPRPRLVTAEPVAATHLDHGAEEPDTPLGIASVNLPDGDDSRFYAALIHEMAENQQASNRRLLAVEEKQDASISDMRAVTASLRTRDEALFGLLGLPAVTETLAQSVASLAKRQSDLETAVGKPPQKLEARASQSGHLTAAELTELEQGTGLAGVVGRMLAEQKRMARKVGIGAAIASGAAPLAIEIFKQVFGG